MKEHRAVKDIPAYLEPQEIYNRYIEGARVQVYSRSIERLQARDLALVTFLYTTGLRISEALAVTKDKIEFDVEGFLVIKGNRILKHRKTLVILDKAIAKQGAMAPFIDVLIQHFKNVKRKHEIFKINRVRAFRIVRAVTGQWPHYFRSQHISYLVNYCGLSTLTVAKLMGISNVQSLEGYHHTEWKKHQEALSK
jgi:integrase